MVAWEGKGNLGKDKGSMGGLWIAWEREGKHGRGLGRPGKRREAWDGVR